jgi:CRP/FNR family transcriptional regulator, polysaccharide utilization system transcription regulator
MNPKILVIEDNAEMADNISCILELAHFDVVRALNGKSGIEEALKVCPDLILCDIMMN